MTRTPFVKVLFALTLLASAASGRGKYWVFFADKHLLSRADSVSALARFRQALTDRCLRRRAKVLPPERLVDWRDLPVWEGYVRAVEQMGAKIIHTTRWFNGVSVVAEDSVIAEIRRLPFVKDVRAVALGRREPEPIPEDTAYGLSAKQLWVENIPPLHAAGFDGDGVLVCITDTGFNPDHIAFAGADVVATWDFVSGDSVVDWQEGDPAGVPSHGSFCWSLLGGKVDGVMCGVAPGASFLLARTEDIGSETPAEEDNWVAAMEWADSLGADVISVSLGYSDWYLPSDMDGDTPVITAAADRAAYLGIAVFAAAGNSGATGYGTLTAPGDGDSVVTVGACDEEGFRAAFSSRGPTADGRTKPDILALGVTAYGADGMSDDGFRYGSGTSAATPIAAGVGALLLQIKPSLDPIALRRSLRMTASNPTAPNNDIGWGIIDAKAAAAYPANDTAVLILEAGWNLIALPVADTVPAEALPIIPPVYTFSCSTFVPVDTLVPGVGYFVLCPTDTFAVLCGNPITELEIHLRRGWNLVGGLSRRTFADELGAGSAVPHLFGYSASLGGYFPDKSAPPGCGRWVFSEEETTLMLSE